MAKLPVKLLFDKLPNLQKTLLGLAEKEVLVGVPAEKTERKERGMNNATLAYIHDNGSPAANIPARPFMQPGIESVKSEIARVFLNGARISLKSESSLDRTLNIVGLMAQTSIKNRINEGIPPPLKKGTLRGRIRKRTSIKGAKQELAARKAGGAPSLTGAKPLIATGQLRNSISYVIRGK